MTTERIVRLVAGSFILAGLVLSQVHSKYWLLFVAFVGANLFQSGITRWCLMEDILLKLGVKRYEDAPSATGPPE